MISIIIPTVRPEKAKRCVDAIMRNAGDITCQIIQEEDKERIGLPKMIKRMVERTEFDNVMFLGDDCIPKPDFLRPALEAMQKLPDGWGVVGLNTEGPTFGSLAGHKIPENCNPIAHWMAHKKMLEHIPGGDFFSLEYHHCWCDNELFEIADEMGRWAFAENCRIEHDHPINKKAIPDDDLKRVYSDEFMRHDRIVYIRRKRERWAKRQSPRLGICIPCDFPLSWFSVFENFILMEKPDFILITARKLDIHTRVKVPIDVMRNAAVKNAQDEGCSHIFFMDADMIPDFDTIPKMLARDYDICAPLMFKRYLDFMPVMVKRRGGRGKKPKFTIIEDWPENEFIEVDAVGTGVMLIKMEVFDRIKFPWFEFWNPGTSETVGEDYAFCTKAKRAGFRVGVDTSIKAYHEEEHPIGEKDYKIHRKLKEIIQKRKRGEENGSHQG